MFLNDAPGALPTMPARSAIGPNPGWFAQNPAGGAGTVLGAEWANMLQAELLGLIAAAGLTADKSNDGQLLAAIRAVGGPPTGFRGAFTGTTAPTGWVRANGKTIGNVASSATERANADTFALFSLYWTQRPELQLYTAAGATIARGASAAVDYAANCALALPDYRGRVGVGQDDMGNVAADRVSNAVGRSGIAGATLGATGGEELHQLTPAEMPSHDHPPNDAASGAPQATSGGVASGSQTGNTGAMYNVQKTGKTGGDGKHNNMQPSIIEIAIIKL